MPKKVYGKAGESVRNLLKRKAFIYILFVFFLIFISLYLYSYVIKNPLVYGWLIIPVFLFFSFLKNTEKLVDKDLEKYQKGARGEEKIGKLLNKLEDEFYVIHDVVIGKGNIDHIVVAPTGIYTIETKSHHGKVTANQDELFLNGRALSKDFLSQSMAEALTVKEYLKKISLGKADYFIQPILVFTNAFVEVRGKVKGVKVLPAEWLISELKKGNEVISKLERSRIAAALAEKSQIKS